MKIKLVLLAVCLLSACNFPTRSPKDNASKAGIATRVVAIPAITATPTSMDLVPVTPASKLIMSETHTGPASSAPFTVSEKGRYRINWQQSSSGKFVLSMINSDPGQLGTAYGRVIFESITGPSARFSDYELIPGQYMAVVEAGDGLWKVWVEYIGPGIQ